MPNLHAFDAGRRPRDGASLLQIIIIIIIVFVGPMVSLVMALVGRTDHALVLLALTALASLALALLQKLAASRVEAVRRDLAELNGFVEAVERGVAALTRARKGC